MGLFTLAFLEDEVLKLQHKKPYHVAKLNRIIGQRIIGKRGY